MTTAQKIIAFDVYGTLLSTESIVHELAKLFGDDKARILAVKWRQYQLEYTWRINCMGRYAQARATNVPLSSLTHPVHSAPGNLPS